MKHTFAELLRVFVALRQVGDDRLTQGDLAHIVGVTKATINNWMKGKYAPRFPEQINKLAQFLELTAFEYDVLAYAVNPAWVKYETPSEIIKNFEINRYRERFTPIIIPDDEPPTIDDIEQHWSIAFKDMFEHNANHWGLGWRDDGVCRVERSIANGCYHLRLENRFHWTTILGGDSMCFAPPVYYVSCDMKCIASGCLEDGYALIFEEVNDSCHTIFRVRDQIQEVSIFRAEAGGDQSTDYLSKTYHAAIRKGQSNKLAIFTNHEQHWFYINNHIIFSTLIPRIAHSRIDVGINSDLMQPVICEYRNFIVRVPPHQPYTNGVPMHQ